MSARAQAGGLVSYAVSAIRERGIAFVWTYFFESMLFDLVHGTNTSVRVAKSEQPEIAAHQDAKDGLLYVASFTSVVNRSLESVRVNFGVEFFDSSQFVDLGCGKGKTLLQFALKARRGNRKPAVGIEYDPSLAEIARRNLQKCNLGADSAVIHTASAVDVCRYVDSEYFIFYLYNSFQGETLRAFLSAVRELPHCLIYVDPVEKQTITSEFDYEIVHSVAGRYNANTWLLASSPKLRANRIRLAA